MAWKVKIQPLVFQKLKMKPEDLSEAENELAKLAKKDTDQYVPARTGTFSRKTKVDGQSIEYAGPSAHKLYMGKTFNFTKTKHPHAQSHWFYGSKKDNIEKWRKAAAKEILKRMK